MYSYLASRIVGASYRQRSKDRLRPWAVHEKATSGEFFTVGEAQAIRDAYFPGESLEALFKEDQDTNALTVAEAMNIVQHTMPGDVMPELVEAVWYRVTSTIENMPIGHGLICLMGWCAVIGRAAGVKEERARRKKVGDGKEAVSA